MAISKPVFAVEMITPDGEALKFDDLHCFSAFKKENRAMAMDGNIYLVNFLEPHNFIPVEGAFLLQSQELHSPMGGNIAAFENRKDLKKIQEKMGGKQINIHEFLEDRN